MKSIKFILINLIVLLVSVSTYAQIKVNSAGHIGIGIDGDSNYKTYIYNPSTAKNARGLYVKLEHPGSDAKQYAIQSVITPAGGFLTYGIYTSACNSTPSSGQAVGIWSRAGNALNGYNYAVFGHLVGSRNGTSIFGAVSSVISRSLTSFKGYFAMRS